ncbi:zinc knuckle CX2CX4HX4C containing protein [Tanacetum coccineum]
MEDGTPLYTPFHYSPEEIEYFSANSGFSDNETKENETVEIDKEVTRVDITPNIKQAPQVEKQNVCYFVEPYEPPIPFPRRLEQHAEEALINPRCSALLQNQLPPKEQDPRSFILPRSIGRLDFNNTLADLGASISIMPFSMYKRLGMGKLKPINMVIEMADNTKSIPKGIVKNLLIKIDKFIFPIDFVILDIIEDYRMPFILGRHLLATTHAKVDIFKKSISLEVGNEKVIFKMRSSFTTTMFESVRAIKSKIYMGDDDSESCEFDQLLDIDPDIFTYDIDMQGSYKEANIDQEMSEEYESVKETNLEQRLNPAEKRVHWYETISQEKEGLWKYRASCDPYNDICDGGGLPNDVEKLYWESTNDNERVDLEWEELSFNNWVRLKFGRVCKMTKDRILKD